jgi:hypothetical protein
MALALGCSADGSGDSSGTGTTEGSGSTGSTSQTDDGTDGSNGSGDAGTTSQTGGSGGTATTSGSETTSGSTGSTGAGFGYRIGYSGDGNQHDPDDWHASPMALALLHEAGMKEVLVHFDYNDHLGDNDAGMAATHRANVETAISLFGYDSEIFYDDQEDLDGAVQSIAAAIDASSDDDHFWLICAGPMEVCWRGIDAADDAKEQLVHVISHSSWNDNHDDTPELDHTWDDIEADFDVQMHHINDQNGPAFNSSCNEWEWLQNIPDYGQSLYDLVCTDSAAGDASDAGMVYYRILDDLDNESSPTMDDVKAFFGQ